MSKYRFRLQKVLDFRRAQEEDAKREYLERRARRLDGELQVAATRSRRAAALKLPCPALEDRKQLELYLERVDDDERADMAALSVLESEEERALGKYTEARRASEVLAKLRERDWQAWRLDEARREQRELDEWAVLRRLA